MLGCLSSRSSPDLVLERLEHGILLGVQGRVARRGVVRCKGLFGHFDLLDRHELAGDGVERNVDGAKGALADEGTLHVLDIVPRVLFEVLAELLVAVLRVLVHEPRQPLVEGAAHVPPGYPWPLSPTLLAATLLLPSS